MRRLRGGVEAKFSTGRCPFHDQRKKFPLLDFDRSYDVLESSNSNLGSIRPITSVLVRLSTECLFSRELRKLVHLPNTWLRGSLPTLE